jgi:hypothetical protein
MTEFGTGLTGRAQKYCRRYRSLLSQSVLAAALLLTGAAAVRSLFSASNLQNLVLLCAAALLAVVPVFIFARHRLATLYTVIAPLAGLIWAAPFAGRAGAGAMPLLAYGFALMAAVSYLEDWMARSVRALPQRPPFRPFWAAIVVMAGLACLWHQVLGGRLALLTVIESSMALVSVTLLLPLMLSRLTVDEDFVVRTNRARERRIASLENLALVATPRWGLSLTGIGVVLAVLGWFEAQRLQPMLLLPFVSAVIVAGAGWIVGGGWREGVGLVIASGVALFLSVWGMQLTSDLSNTTPLQISMLTVGLALQGLWAVRLYRYGGEMPGAARGRVLEEASGQIVSVVAGMLALLPIAIIQHDVVAALFTLFAAGAIGILLALAVVTALETLFPRSRSLEELYGRKRPPKH